ncbi:D-alanine--D-alanine ligase [Photobacterium jeanii]|nr:D-alanine--D-alanine ligase [Photobacterium jeanii]
MLKRIAVLYGGCSSERTVSLMSGEAVSAALSRKGYEVVPVDIDENFDITTLKQYQVDKAFLALHGGIGEDGTLQAALKMLNIPYTGSHHRASAIGIDKSLTKKVWQAAGIPTPNFVELQKDFFQPNQISERFANFTFPVVVKPATQGCSIGINQANDMEELKFYIDEAFKYEDTILVEAYVHGREYTVSILGDQVLPSVEIKHSHSFFDHEAKFKSADTKYLCPAELTEEQEKAIRSLARRAFDCVGASGWGRVDIMADEKGYFYAIEVNTIPGMTERSVFPLASQEAGLNYDDTVDAILNV